MTPPPIYEPLCLQGGSLGVTGTETGTRHASGEACFVLCCSHSSSILLPFGSATSVIRLSGRSASTSTPCIHGVARCRLAWEHFLGGERDNFSCVVNVKGECVLDEHFTGKRRFPTQVKNLSRARFRKTFEELFW